MMNKDSKKYHKSLKLFLPVHGNPEKQLFDAISSRLTELNLENPEITYEELCNELGAPQEIVSDYFSTADPEYLSKKLRFSQSIRRAFWGFILTLLILSCVRTFYLHRAYQAVVEAQPDYHVDIIE